jgi:hypothetical protein
MLTGARLVTEPPSRGCLPRIRIGHPDRRKAIDCPRLCPQTRTSLGRRRPRPGVANRSCLAEVLRAREADSASAPTTPRECAHRANHGWEWLPVYRQEKHPSPREPRPTTWCEPIPGPCPVRHPARSTKIRGYLIRLAALLRFIVEVFAMLFRENSRRENAYGHPGKACRPFPIWLG